MASDKFPNLRQASSDEKISPSPIVDDAPPVSSSSASSKPRNPNRHPQWLSAWSKVLASLILFFNTWGILLTFGAFQAVYETSLLRSHSSSAIAWIGTTFAFILLLGGVFSGKVHDLGHSRALFCSGSFLVVFGLMMTSLATEYYQVFLAQGIAVGFGTSMLYVPAMAVVASEFGKPGVRAVVIGIVSAGSSVGGVVYPVMFRGLEPRIGFAWTVRVLAFTALGTFAVALAILLPPAPSRSASARRIFDRTAWTDPPFVMYMVSGLFSGMGYFTPLVFLPSFAESAIPNLDNSDVAFYALAVANGASSVSRIGGGFVAAKFGPLPTFTFALLGSSILLFAWIAVNSVAGLMVWTALLGVTTGLIISMPGAIVPQLCPSPALFGTRIGMSFIGSAIGVLIGGPIGGKLIYAVSADEPIWWPLQAFTGLCMLIAAALVVYPWIHVSRKLRGSN